MSSGWRWGVALVALVAALGGPAAAQESAAKPDPGELELIRKGISAREQGRDLEAFDLFKQAFDKYKTPRAQAQMALAAQALGRWAEADEQLRAALGAGSDAWITSNRRALEQAQAVITQHVGSLEVLGNVPGTEVTVDGRMRGKLPLPAPLRLATGTVIVHLVAEGYATVQRSVTIYPGQLTRETFELVELPRTAAAPAPLPPAPPEATATTSLPPPPERMAALRRPWVVAAGGAATAVLGGVTIWSGLNTLSARDRYEEMPTRTGYEDGVGRERRTNLLLGGTLLVAVATAGLALFLTSW